MIGDWDAGYFCTAIGTKSKVTPDGYASNNGAICPIGKFCVAGTTTPVDYLTWAYYDCAGFRPTDFYQCLTEFYWDKAGLSDYSSRNWYSSYSYPKGISASITYHWSIGYSWPAGATDKIIWGDGAYQDTDALSSCKTWTKGNY